MQRAVDHAIREHPERERIVQLLTGGAQPVTYPVEDGRVRVTVHYLADDPRSSADGPLFELTTVPAGALKRVNVG